MEVGWKLNGSWMEVVEKVRRWNEKLKCTCVPHCCAALQELVNGRHYKHKHQYRYYYFYQLIQQQTQSTPLLFTCVLDCRPSLQELVDGDGLGGGDVVVLSQLACRVYMFAVW
jgi:hypothetical protein